MSGAVLSTSRPHRPAYLSPEALDAIAADEGLSEAELLSRLEDALAALPAPEREAVVTALGYGEGTDRVAAEQGLAPEQAEALTRSALQLLRGALAGCSPDPALVHPHGRRRRTTHPRAE